MYLQTPYKIKYDTERFPFRKVIQEILEVNDLEKIHEVENYELLSREQDQKTIWHSKYYEKFKEKFEPLYIEFISHIKERFEYPEIVYQKIPTFRVHMVENVGVGEWHKDRTYEHGITEVNFWLPFVDTYDTNTIWMESKEDKGDYIPYDVKYGEILVFDGANLTHGNKINKSKSSRISVDFRLVDPAKFIPNTKGSINMRTPFDIGGYFEKM
jgi:ectoine hydroxylase-related dioxygenase (phytanoyl-CoA dioxygenase family)